MMLKSPINSGPVVVEKELNVSEISNLYQREFNFNVSKIFGDQPVIRLYRCVDSGYRFFYPFNISGTAEFYEHMGKYPWYYSPWRWEHEKSLAFIEPNNKVLEIGSGEGAFIRNASRRKKAQYVGLELNALAVAKGKDLGLDLRNESVQAHAEQNREGYDVVCSYQVLEHIAEVGGAINSMIDCLKPGGSLIIAVPNNDSFLKTNPLPSRILNMPPHHMGLWDRKSLESLVRFFSLIHQETLLEPLQTLHQDTYLYSRIDKFFLNINLFTRAFWKLRLHIPARFILRLFRHKIQGHTIMIVFKKRSI